MLEGEHDTEVLLILNFNVMLEENVNKLTHLRKRSVDQILPPLLFTIFSFIFKGLARTGFLE